MSRFALLRRGRGSPTPTPTPTPTPGEPTFPTDYPAWLTIADRPNRPPALGGSATVNPSNFASVLAGLLGTEGTLYCEGGDYGSSFNITKAVSAGQVRLAAADPEDPPRWVGNQTTNSGQFKMTGAKNLWFDGWEFSQPVMTNDTDTYGIPRVAPILGLYECENIRVTRGKLIGGVGATYGIGTGTGLQVSGSVNCQFDRIGLYNLSYGFRATNTKLTDTLCQNLYFGFMDFNRANGCGGVDFFDFYGVDGAIVEYCEYWDTFWLPDDLHADFLQLGVVNTDFRGSQNVLVRRNLIGATDASTYTSPATDGRTHNYQQGVWIADATGANDFPNVVVEDNELYGASNNGISHVEGPQNFLARRNELVRSSRADYQTGNGGGGIVQSRIWIDKETGLGQSISDVTLQDNITPVILLGSGVTVTESGNTIDTTQQSDVQFEAARTVWEAARASYF